MKEFWAYFLGQGDTVEFENFSLTHLLAILSGVLMIYVIYRFRDRLAQYRHEARLRHLLAFGLIFSEMSYYWRLIAVPSLGGNPIDHLPITVCGWAVVFCSYMVIGKSQTLFDISYFWLFSGSLFALLTPTVITYTGPTRFRFYQFWMEHLLGYAAIFYMIFVHKMRPTIKSAVKSYAALVVLAVIAYATNQMLGPGANYLFMARPESTPSVLDILPPNFALRIAVMAAVITLMFGLAYLPWYLKDRKVQKQLSVPGAN
ncbi:MAG: TIGR02206 family membrane protein [Clostridia bacterium]|nr:TIGR02206 family membrane protein [Clostridia bacterium]